MYLYIHLNVQIYLKIKCILVYMPLQMTYLNFHIVDIFSVAQCNPGIVSIVSTVVDVYFDKELLLVVFYEKTIIIQK